MNEVFSNNDRLLLLQLMTKRAIAERVGQERQQEEADLDNEGNTNVGTPAEVVPEIWRLVPEGVSLYKWQLECLPLWLLRGHGTVKVATGGGKTLFALAAAQQLQNDRDHNLRMVVVVPTIPLLFQWYDEIKKGNLPDSAIGLMGGGQELVLSADLRVLICVLNSARDRLPHLVTEARWAERMLLVVDECHRANAEEARRIFDSKPKYTLGLSATPEQDIEAEGLPADEAYEQSVVGIALGPIIYDFTIKQSLAAGLLTPFEVWHIGLSLSPEEAIDHARLSREISELRKDLQRRHRISRSTQGFLAWCQTQASRRDNPEAKRFVGLANQRKRLLYRAKARTDVALGILAESVTDPEGRAIVFHESIEEIEALFLRTLDMQLPSVLEHSKLPDSLRANSIDIFRRGISRIIISAKSLVEGFNVPSADLGIIAASSGSVRQRIQSLGRMLRRKECRSARIMVLYVRDTEDESIYERADWENIIGAERNRYFNWNSDPANEWTHGLQETSKPPRSYRPPSWDVDITKLHLGDSYPGQTGGLDLHVDQAGNLRDEQGTLIPVSPGYIAALLERNQHRRGRRTPAGHLIVRVDSQKSDEEDWRFLGSIVLPNEPGPSDVKILRLSTNRGRRVISIRDERGRGGVRFALGPDNSRTLEGGQTRDRLLQWVHDIAAERAITVREIFWDGQSTYWLEISGERIHFGGFLAPLEFPK